MEEKRWSRVACREQAAGSTGRTRTNISAGGDGGAEARGPACNTATLTGHVSSLTKDFKKPLKLLNSNGFEYLPIGAYAVNICGYARTT